MALIAERAGRLLRELRIAGLAIVGAVGAFTYTFDASLSAAVLALLGVSAVGWIELMRESPDLALEDELAMYLRRRYGWGAVVQIVPPWLFFASVYYHSHIHFIAEEFFFIGAGLITSVPVVGLGRRVLRMHRLTRAEIAP